MAGDKAHSPRQRTVRSVNRPDLSVSPGPMPSSFSSRSSKARRAAGVARRARADFDDVPADRLEAERVVETGHAQDLGQLQFQRQARCSRTSRGR